MKRVLFCVLNWGIGHATRSVPIIQYLLDEGHDVMLASDGLAKEYLVKQFPQIDHHVLPSYNARYVSNSLLTNLARSIPSILKAIGVEHHKVGELVSKYKPDLILSDNRYGCFHESTQNILISHQLRLMAPTRLAQKVSNQFLAIKLKPFQELWVPDFEPPGNLTTVMSSLSDPRVKYIGPLSDMGPCKGKTVSNRLLYLLSGPEPARSKFEEILLALDMHQTFDCELIRGSRENNINYPTNLQVTHLASSTEVGKAIKNAEYIVCRSGYSTIMDLQYLGKKAIFIPTPAQPEQLLLAKSIAELGKGVFLLEDHLNQVRLLEKMREIDELPKFAGTESFNFKLHIDRVLI